MAICITGMSIFEGPQQIDVSLSLYFCVCRDTGVCPDRHILDKTQDDPKHLETGMVVVSSGSHGHNTKKKHLKSCLRSTLIFVLYTDMHT